MNKIKFCQSDDDLELVIFGNCIETINNPPKSLDNPSIIKGIGEDNKKLTVSYGDTSIEVPLDEPLYGFRDYGYKYYNQAYNMAAYQDVYPKDEWLICDEIHVSKNKVYKVKKIYKHVTSATENSVTYEGSDNNKVRFHTFDNINKDSVMAIDEEYYVLLSANCVLSPQFISGSEMYVGNGFIKDGQYPLLILGYQGNYSGSIFLNYCTKAQEPEKFQDNTALNNWFKEYNSTHEQPITFIYPKRKREVIDLSDTDYGKQLMALVPKLQGLPQVTDGTNNVRVQLQRPGVIKATKLVEPMFTVDPILANNDLETIKRVAQAGLGANYWSVGDKYPVTLNGTISKTIFNNETYYAFIIGFNHNPEYEGVHSIHFQFAMDATGKQIAFTEEYNKSYSGAGNYGFVMNVTDINANGWEKSYMRQTLMPQFLNLLSDEWQSVITETTKYTDNVGGGNGHIQDNVTSTKDKVFLLSGFEVFSTNNSVNSHEKNYQQRYAYYANGGSRKFYNHQSLDSSVMWWLRSPVRSSSSNFCNVYTTGSTDNGVANYSLGLAPGIVIS